MPKAITMHDIIKFQAWEGIYLTLLYPEISPFKKPHLYIEI